jgi:tryptophanyl-tRNA synthetase
LIYKADYVPVGKDQVQHLELTRDIAIRFNSVVKKEYFVLPEYLLTATPKIRSTADPTRKMSKSAGEKHYISLFAEEDRIRKQIKSAVTDTGTTPSDKMSEGVENLFELIKASGNVAGHDALMHDYNAGKLKYSDLKEVTVASVLDLVRPIQARKAEIINDKKKVKDAIKASSENIRSIAKQTLQEVKELTGLLNVK